MTSRKAIAGAFAAAGLAAALAAGAAASESPVTAANVTTSASLSADPHGALRFNTHRLTVKAGAVTLHMHDPATSGTDHGIAVTGHHVNKVGHIVSPGQVSTLVVHLRPGTYTFYCPVPGHRAAGMHGTLVVR